jgi:hypothetical protein
LKRIIFLFALAAGLLTAAERERWTSVSEGVEGTQVYIDSDTIDYGDSWPSDHIKIWVKFVSGKDSKTTSKKLQRWEMLRDRSMRILEWVNYGLDDKVLDMGDAPFSWNRIVPESLAEAVYNFFFDDSDFHPAAVDPGVAEKWTFLGIDYFGARTYVDDATVDYGGRLPSGRPLPSDRVKAWVKFVYPKDSKRKITVELQRWEILRNRSWSIIERAGYGSDGKVLESGSEPWWMTIFPKSSFDRIYVHLFFGQPQTTRPHKATI